jgi:single-strand DNA-binding protein
MGNLTATPELRSTTTGKNVANFSVATNNVWRNDEGERQSTADFHRVVAWQGLADQCEKYLSKGSPVYIEGRLHTRSYEDKESNKKSYTEITAEKVNFIQTKRAKEGDQVMLRENEEEAVAA